MGDQFLTGRPWESQRKNGARVKPSAPRKIFKAKLPKGPNSVTAIRYGYGSDTPGLVATLLCRRSTFMILGDDLGVPSMNLIS